MFWKKRTPQFNQPTSTLGRLANRLGVERRYSARIRYPKGPISILPQISFNNRRLEVRDISIGGCCLLDPNEFLGPAIGLDVHLILEWPDGPVSVHSRIVSRVDHRRHIQFLNLPSSRLEQLRAAIVPGTYGLDLRPVCDGTSDGPVMQAREVWSSLKGDAVIIEDDLQRLAQITIAGRNYIIFKEAWPAKAPSLPLTQNEFAELILFLSNIPQPSDLLEAFIAHLENLILRGAP